MVVKIDKKICIGCNRCVDVCPGNLLELDKSKKAKICDPSECWDCSACVKECPVNAIEIYLQAEIGGAGSTLKAEMKEESVVWTLKDKDGNEEVIEVSNKQSTS